MLSPPSSQARTTNAPRALTIALFLGCLAVYLGNGQLIGTGDAIGARLIPFSILLDGTVTLDRFFSAQVGSAEAFARAPRTERMRYYYLAPRHGRLYSSYPIGVPIVITPLYAPIIWAKGDWSTEEVLRFAPAAEKFVAALIAALSVAAMHRLLLRLSDRRSALVLTLAFAFGTTTWTTSSQALWQHGPGVLCMLLALVFLVRDPPSLWLVGLFAGMAVMMRPSNLFFWLAVLLVCAWKGAGVRRMISLALPGVVMGAAMAAFNQSIFGTPLGSYGAVDDAFSGRLMEGLVGLMVSPSRGLIVYSPVLLAGLAGSYVYWRGGALFRSPVYAVAALFFASQWIFFGWWDAWWGGWSYGPRLLTEAAAMLVILSVPAMERLRSRRLAHAAFLLALIYSIAVQAIGALAYSPPVWNAEPVNVDVQPSRAWDWRDAQIPRTVGVFLSGDWFAGCRTLTEWLTERCPPPPGRHVRASSGDVS